MAEERELILKLGQKITDRIGHKVTVEDPEYYGLACVVTDEMAEIALKMKVRKPMTLDQVAKATGKSKKYLEPLLQEMSSIGLLEYNWENPSRTKQYVLPMFVPGSAEFFNMKKDQIDAHPELAKFFERMTFLPLEKITAMVPPGGAGIGMHVIPVEKAIETENQSVDVEHISHWLKKYDLLKMSVIFVLRLYPSRSLGNLSKRMAALVFCCSFHLLQCFSIICLLLLTICGRVSPFSILSGSHFPILSLSALLFASFFF